MQLEVEQKYPVDDHAALRSQLSALGCVFESLLEQADLYFAHPARDFKQTDEALRLRRSVAEGKPGEACITYKGPKVDATTKTRREIELPLAADEYQRYCELLEVLGFQPVMEVRKRRVPGKLCWEETEVEVALDDVVGLGTFIEIEILTSAEGLDTARQRLVSLASRLGLQESQRRGYLDLLMEKSGLIPHK